MAVFSVHLFFYWFLLSSLIFYLQPITYMNLMLKLKTGMYLFGSASIWKWKGVIEESGFKESCYVYSNNILAKERRLQFHQKGRSMNSTGSGKSSGTVSRWVLVSLRSYAAERTGLSPLVFVLVLRLWIKGNPKCFLNCHNWQELQKPTAPLTKQMKSVAVFLTVTSN